VHDLNTRLSKCWMFSARVQCCSYQPQFSSLHNNKQPPRHAPDTPKPSSADLLFCAYNWFIFSPQRVNYIHLNVINDQHKYSSCESQLHTTIYNCNKSIFLINQRPHTCYFLRHSPRRIVLNTPIYVSDMGVWPDEES